MSSNPSERVAVLGVVDPDANAAGALVSDYGDASKFNSFMAIGFAGVMGASATIDMKLTQATSSAGAGAKDVSGKAITQLVKATDDDKQAIINLRADQLDVAGGFSFVAITFTVGAATSDSGAVLLGLDPVHSTAADSDLASVAEIIA